MKRIIFLFVVLALSGCIRRPQLKPEGVEPETLFHSALKFYSHEEWAKADSAFKKVILSTKDRALIGKSYYYLGKIAETENKLRSALVYFSHAYKYGYGDRKSFLVLLQKVPPGILEKELNRIPETLKPEALYILGNSYLKEGNEKKSLKIFRLLSSKYPDSPFTTRVRRFLEAGKRYRIAVILPFTGEFSDVAGIIKNTIEEKGSENFYYIYFDNRADPVKTYEIVSEVVKKGYNGIIGPVLSSNSVVASVLCNYNSVPMVSPTATSAIVDSFGPYALTINKSLILEGYAIADYALNTLGFRKAAVIYPSTEYGKRPYLAFKSYFESHGGKIVYTGEFLSGQKNFKDMLRSVNRSGAEMLFIPGSSEDLLSLIPQIKYFGVKAQILGGDGWHSYQLLKEVGSQYLEGVVFADLIFRDNNGNNKVDETKRLSALSSDAVMVLESMVVGRNLDDVENMMIAGSIHPEKDIEDVPLFIVTNGKFERIR